MCVTLKSIKTSFIFLYQFMEKSVMVHFLLAHPVRGRALLTAADNNYIP